MKLKELINKSYYVSIGFVDSIESLNMLEKYIIHNLNVLKEFKGVVVATNYKESYYELRKMNTNLWNKYIPGCHLIIVKNKILTGYVNHQTMWYLKIVSWIKKLVRRIFIIYQALVWVEWKNMIII